MANKTCPGCGAEMSKIQGYNFVCQYCGTVTPVDPQTRAMIDAQQRQRIVAQQIENNKIADKKFKKGCLIAIGIFVVLIVLGAIYNKCQRDKWREQDEKNRQEMLKKNEEQRIADAARNNKNIPEELADVSLDDFYISPSSIFSNSGNDGIGHLSQNLRSTLKQKGFVEEGTEHMSYYGSNNITGVPIISVKFNSYFPNYGADRKNESDDIHSVKIEISDATFFNDFKARFIKELRSIGFAKEDVAGSGYESSSEMIGKDFLRIGDVINSEEGYIQKTYCNWDAVEIKDYDRIVECIAYREF